MGRPGGSQETWPGAAVFSVSAAKIPSKTWGWDGGDGFRKFGKALLLAKKNERCAWPWGMGPHPMYFLIFAKISSAKVHIFTGSDVGRLCWDEFLGNY